MEFQELFKQAYNQSIVNTEQFKIQGIKMLILDKLTLKTVTQMITQTQLSNDEIALCQLITKVTNMPPTPHVSGLFMLAPTTENVSMLVSILSFKTKKFQSVFVTFISQPSDADLERLAQADKFVIIQSLKIVFAQFLPITPQLVICQNALSILSAYGSAPFSVRYQVDSAQCLDQANLLARQLGDLKSQFKQNQQMGKSKAKPVEVVFVERKSNAKDNLAISLNMLSLMGDFKNLEDQGVIMCRGKETPVSYYTFSEQVQKCLSLDCYQVLDQVSAFKEQSQKQALQMQQQAQTDLEQQSKFLAQQDLVKQQQNEYKNLGQFVAENKELVTWYLAINNMQQEILSHKLTKMDSETFKQIKSALSKKDQLEIPQKESVTKMLCCGVLTLIYLLPSQNTKINEQNLQHIKEFLDFLGAFCPSLNQYIESTKQKTRMAPSESFDWQQIQNAGVLAKQSAVAFKNQFPKSQIAGIPQSCAFYQYKPNIVALAEAALAFKLPGQLFPVLQEYKQAQLDVQNSGETPIVVIYQIGGTSFKDANDLVKYDDGDITRAVQQRVVLAGPKIQNWLQYIDSIVKQ